MSNVCVCVSSLCLQDFINQLMAMETVITQARSLKTKFAVCEGEKGEDSEELEK